MSHRLSSITAMLVMSAALLCSCVHHSARNEGSGGVVKEWSNLLDEIEVAEPFNLNDYSQIIVTKLDTAGTPLPPEDDNTYEPTSQAVKAASDVFANGLEHELKEAKTPLRVVGPNGAPAGRGTLLLKGKVVQMHPGSRAMRAANVFGGGRAIVEIEGEIVDATSSRSLVKFKHARASGTGFFGGDYAKLLNDDTQWVGEDVGKMLQYFARGNER